MTFDGNDNLINNSTDIMDFVQISTDADGNNTFTINNQATKATYRLIVKYGDKTQYINFIIN